MIAPSHTKRFGPKPGLGRAGHAPASTPPYDLRAKLIPVTTPRAHVSASLLQDLRLLSSEELAQGDYRHSWLIENVLVQGWPCILGGPFKTLKTSLLIDLALSVGGARLDPEPRFLGAFPAPAEPRPVLFFCAESGLATIQETARRVAAARRMDLPQSLVYWGDRVPRIQRDQGLSNLERAVRSLKGSLVIIDPLYLCLGGEANIASLSDMGGRLSEISSICTEHGATLVLAHHSRKSREVGRRQQPLELEELAFAGVAEFARQWILVSRRTEYRPGSGRHELWLNLGGSAGTSGLYAVDVDEGTLNPDFTGRCWNVSVENGHEVREQAVAARQAQQDSKVEAQRQADQTAVLEHLKRPEAALGDSRSGMAQALEIARKRVEAALQQLAADGLVVATQVQKGNRRCSGYRLADPTASPRASSTPQ